MYCCESPKVRILQSMKAKIQSIACIVLGLALLILSFIVLFNYAFDPLTVSYVKAAWAVVAAGFAVLGSKIMLQPNLGNLTRIFGNYAWSYILILNIVSVAAIISAALQ